jgi:MFS family permease
VRALRDVFANAGLRRLQVTWAGFILADSAYAVGLAVLAFRAGGAAAVGIAMVARLLPAALATPVVTAYGDRHAGERVLAVTLAVRAAAMAGVAVVAVTTGLPLLALYALVVVDTVAMTAFRPVHTVLLVPASRSPRELSAANSATSLIESVSGLIGPLGAAVLLATASSTWVFVAAAGLFLGSAAVAVRMEAARRTPVPARQGYGGLGGELRASARLVGMVPGSVLVLGLFSAQALVKGAWLVATPVVALELLRTGDAGVGALTAALGAGGLVGALGTLALAGRRRLAGPFAAGLALWGPPIAVIALVPDPALALGLAGILGAGKGLTYVAGLSLLQRMMATEVLGRAFGLLQSFALVATGVGAIVTPLLIAAVGLEPALVGLALLMPVLVAASWTRFRSFDRTGADREREVALLRDVSIFAPLPALELEQLAAAVIPLTLPAGTEIIRQGESGDRFYVILEGEVDVFVDEAPARRMGPGGWFGELALLRDAPRSATVRARTEVDLYALDREPFLTALTGRPAGLRSALGVAEARLEGAPLEPGR